MKRDTDTFLSLVTSNKGLIYKVASLYCKDGEDKKDLIQEIVIQLWLSFSHYDEKYKLSTWIYRIALNVSISFYRKNSRRKQINQSLPEEVLHLQEDSMPVKNEALEQLHRFIRELKEIDRAIVILYLDGNSQQETSDVLGITVTNVSTRFARIKQQLKQQFSALNLNNDGKY